MQFNNAAAPIGKVGNYFLRVFLDLWTADDGRLEKELRILVLLYPSYAIWVCMCLQTNKTAITD